MPFIQIKICFMKILFFFFSLSFFFFSNPCTVSQIEIENDCLEPSPAFKDIFSVPLGENTFKLKSMTKTATHKLLLIISFDKCDFADNNRCRSYNSKGSQTQHIEPIIKEDTYIFTLLLGVNDVYYTLVQLAPNKVKYIF